MFFQECHNSVCYFAITRRDLRSLMQKCIILLVIGIALKVSTLFVFNIISKTCYLVLCQNCKENKKRSCMVYFDLWRSCTVIVRHRLYYFNLWHYFQYKFLTQTKWFWVILFYDPLPNKSWPLIRKMCSFILECVIIVSKTVHCFHFVAGATTWMNIIQHYVKEWEWINVT